MKQIIFYAVPRHKCDVLVLTLVNAYVQNRQQPRLETLVEIAVVLDIDVRELIISNKVTD